MYESISVVIPTYNRAELICRAVNSAFSQTLPPGEVIVVDDGSTDETKEVLRRHFGNRVRYHCQENQGVAAARNTGIGLASHDLVAFLDSDDMWMPQKLARQVAEMFDRSVVLSATNWAWEGDRTGAFENLGHPIQPPVRCDRRPLLRLCDRRGHGLLVQTTICRRDVLIKLGGFDTALRITEDMDLLFRMADEGTFVIHSEILMKRGSAREGSLTETASHAWREENLDNMIRLLSGRVSRHPPYGPAERRALARRLAQLMVNRAAVACEGRDYEFARKLYRQGVRFPGSRADRLYCGIGSVSPRLLSGCRATGRAVKRLLGKAHSGKIA